MNPAGEDTLSDARQAGRWLSTLTRDSAEACNEVARALRNARNRFGQFSIECQRAVLLVDKWAAPMQSALLEELVTAGPPMQERGSASPPRSARSTRASVSTTTRCSNRCAAFRATTVTRT